MLQLSKFPVKTQKTTPKWSDNRSTGLLLQWWFIRQELAWAYHFLPLGLKVLRNIEGIVREEMNAIWAHEVLMTTLWSKLHWEQTWRWDILDVMFKLKGHKWAEYSVNSTHEEMIVPIMKDFIQSYKDLNFWIYQIQNKFRNEARAKSGILRWREFLMKDLYSFHRNNEDFEEYYEMSKKAYTKIFDRVWLWKDTFITVADGGTFTEKYSHEFQVRLEIWEDLVFKVPWTDLCYNQEVTPSKVKDTTYNDKEILPLKEVKWEGIVGVEPLAKFLNIPVEKTTKTMLFETNAKEVVAAAVRWDYEVNEIKLKKVLGCTDLVLLSEEKIQIITSSEVGYAGLLNLPKEVKIIMDDSMKGRMNFEMWSNKTDYHTINVNFWRDLDEPKEFYDIKLAKKWDLDPETWKEFEVFKASEVGNIFPLETKFTDAFKVHFTNENWKDETVIMGCYGIWVSRVMWVIAEYCMDEKWLVWPENIAPYDYYILPIWEENCKQAFELAKKFESEWKSVIVDDRDVGFGHKAQDADLLGIPNRVIISRKTLEKWGYELKKRTENEWEIIKL